jgi:hypothetical protein
MALTKEQLKALSAEKFPDNTTGAITPEGQREVNDALIDFMDMLRSKSWEAHRTPGQQTITALAVGGTTQDYLCAGDESGRTYASTDKGQNWTQDTGSCNGFEIGDPGSIFGHGTGSSGRFAMLKSPNIYSAPATSAVIAAWSPISGRAVYESGSKTQAFIDIAGTKDSYSSLVARGASSDRYMYYHITSSPTYASVPTQVAWVKTPPFDAPFPTLAFTTVVTRKNFGAISSGSGLKILLVGHGREESTDPYTVFVMVFNYATQEWTKYDIYTMPEGKTGTPSYGLTTSSSRAYLSVSYAGVVQRLYRSTNGTSWVQCELPIDETAGTDLLSAAISGYGAFVAIPLPQGRILYSLNGTDFNIYNIPDWEYSSSSTATTAPSCIDVSRMSNVKSEYVIAFAYSTNVWLMYINASTGEVVRTVRGGPNDPETINNISKIALCGDTVLAQMNKTVQYVYGSPSTAAPSGVWCADYGAVQGGWRRCGGIITARVNKLAYGTTLFGIPAASGMLFPTTRSLSGATTLYSGGLLKEAGSFASLRAWTPSTAYAVGDRVIYQQSTFECLTAHTSGTAFSTAYWTPAYSTTTQYVRGDKVKYGNGYISSMIYRCIVDAATPGAFDAYEWEWDESNQIFLPGTTTYAIPARNSLKMLARAPFTSLPVFACGTIVNPDTIGVFRQAACSVFIGANTPGTGGFYRLPITLPDGYVVAYIRSIAPFTYTPKGSTGKYPALWVSGYSVEPKTKNYKSFCGWTYYAGTSSVIDMSLWKPFTLVAGYNATMMPDTDVGGAVDMFATDNSFLILGGASGYIQITRDMGATWEAAFRPGNSANVIQEFAYSASAQLLGLVKNMSGGAVTVTPDFGMTWESLPLPVGAGSPVCMAIGYYGDIYVGGTLGRVFVNRWFAG